MSSSLVGWAVRTPRCFNLWSTLYGKCRRKTEHLVNLKGHYTTYRHDKVTDKRYLYPMRHSRLSLNYRKKVQLAQLVRESDFFVCVKWQIKTVLTNVVAEQVKSHMSNAKQGNGDSVIHNKLELNMLMCNVMMFY